MFGNCNHCCFCCGHPSIMLGVSLFISCKNKIQCVCVEKKKKELACQCKGHGFEPWPGKIPHATEQLSPCATTTEPEL